MSNIKNLINSILGKFNYRVINTAASENDKYFELDATIKIKIKPYTMLNDIRLKNIIDTMNCISQNKIDGDIVECGVWKGGSVALMAHTMLKNNDLRNLHLFDAFDEICQPDAAVDGTRAIREVGGLDNAKGKLEPVKGIYNNDTIGGAGNEEQVLHLLTEDIGFPSEKIHLHKGWFQDVLPTTKHEIKKIALLRLDGDWYASTKVCLDHLFEKLIIGGILIVDDYGAYEGCKKAVDEYCQNNNIYPIINNVDSECIYWIKQA